ncbi:Short-chain dehydrogenase/reductase SDR [Penicillium camemberti]|uniref:Short-chain dehydrogenase/reductase SDR n=1 Tax=Penicillium camemberti (strain FM 013) TaxID=1429867 RepID=A0A0G4P902_PENC3|nr:Short-chain dehydrogenase/reductase SDR [Penicillium camemberti]
MIIALVTGANQGIGLEVTKKLAVLESHHVLMGCRDPVKGRNAAEMLQGQGLDVEFVHLDVTNDETIREAASYIEAEFGKLDILVHNAGISNDREIGNPDKSLRGLYKEQFDTNVFGAAELTDALVSLLNKSAAARVVFTSSSMASLAYCHDSIDSLYDPRFPIYRTSKAAINMLCLHYAAQYRHMGWKVNVVDPGHVATNLNRFKGPNPVESGAVQTARMATMGTDGPTGTFSRKEGGLPW